MENERRVMCAGFLFAFIITTYNVQSDLLRHFPPSSEFSQPLNFSSELFIIQLHVVRSHLEFFHSFLRIHFVEYASHFA